MTEDPEDASRVGDAARSSAWSPFRHPVFTALWSATTISNMGMWMNDVGAGWLISEMHPSPAVVALVPVATSLPVFLFALPAGAIADIVDRRRMLLLVNVFTLLCAVVLTALVAVGMATVPSLLILVFLLGAGAAFMAPVWQAIVPDLVPARELPAAVALNSMGINIARAVGPGLAGLILVPFGVAVLFGLNAISRIGVIAALYKWSPPRQQGNALPPETVGRAILTGLRYALHNAELKATLIRAVCFFVFASLYWAILPLIARERLAGGPALYGLLLTLIGAGAVAGAIVLPRLRRGLAPDRLVLMGSFGTAVAMVLFAIGQHILVGAAGALLAGASWIAVLSTLNVSAQSALPNWVRARGLAVFITAFFGAMAGGGLLWGQIASTIGIANALFAAAAALVLVALWAMRFRLAGGGLDLAASAHWLQVMPRLEFDRDHGPAMIEITYRILPEDRDGFLCALYAFREERYRHGAYDWHVFEDVERPGDYTEYFQIGSWLDHLRQHDRVTVADRGLQAAVLAFHKASAPPKVRHLLAPVDRKRAL